MNVDMSVVRSQSRKGLRVLVAVVLVLVALGPAVFLWQVLQPQPEGDAAETLAKCAENKAKRAAPSGQDAIELQTNRARPTLAIALADKQSAVDSITFSSKDRQLVPDDDRLGRTSAVMLETPRRSAAEPFDGAVGAKATADVGGTIVRLAVCVDRGAILKAGAFQGTARIFGPRVAEFDYAVIVTQKWPWQIAVATLWYAGLAFVLVAWRTRSLTFTGDGTVLTSVAGLAFGLIAMLPAFFGAYWNNATWGSDPGVHVTGLATAGFTAALAGLAAAQKVLGGSNGGGDDDVDAEESVLEDDGPLPPDDPDA